MIVIHAKPGTHPGCYMRVKSLRRLPIVGERILTKRSTHLGKICEDQQRWAGWRVTEIHKFIDDDLFLLEASWP